MENREAIEWLKGCVVSYEVDNKGRPNGNITCDLTQEVLDLAISALEKQGQDRWHSVAKEGNPKENGEYLVTRGFIPYLDIVKKVGDPPIASDIVAWRPLPEPYTEEEA